MSTFSRLFISHFSASQKLLFRSASTYVHSRPLARDLAKPFIRIFVQNNFVTRGSAKTLFGLAGTAGLGLGISMAITPKVYCDEHGQQPIKLEDEHLRRSYVPPREPAYPPPPESSVNKTDLSFGIVAGICSGVFVKKGAKAVAFVLGGVFVLLQYLRSLSLIRVDYGKMNSMYQRAFYTKDEFGNERAPSITWFFSAIIDFLTADFQARASFIAGFGLGLRIG